MLWHGLGGILPVREQGARRLLAVFSLAAEADVDRVCSNGAPPAREQGGGEIQLILLGAARHAVSLGNFPRQKRVCQIAGRETIFVETANPKGVKA